MGKVTLDDLFRTKIETTFRGRKLYLRALSDFDLQARDERALLAMAKKREELANPQSDAYKIYIAPLEDADDDALRQICLAFKRGEYVRESVVEIRPELYPFPDDADDAEKTEVLKKRDAEGERIGTLRLEFIEGKCKSFEQESKGLEREKLLALAKHLQVEAQGRIEFARIFDEYTVYATVFTDAECQTRLCESMEKAGELETTVRGELVKLYYDELDRVTAEELNYFFSMDASADSSPPSKDLEDPGQLLGKVPIKSPGGGRAR